MWEVFDVNTYETLHTFQDELNARLCAIDMNKPHLDKLYKVRVALSDED